MIDMKSSDYDPSGTGVVSALAIALAIRKTGKQVFFPFSEEKGAIDLIFGDSKSLKSVQCKTAHLSRGSIEFQCCRSKKLVKTAEGEIKYLHRRYYVGEFDYFGVFCPENDKSYLIEVSEDILSCYRSSLRVDLPGNRLKNIRWAVDFEVEYVLGNCAGELPSNSVFANYKNNPKPACIICEKEVNRRSSMYCSIQCKNVSQIVPNKPTKQELEVLLKNSSKTEIGKKYNVTSTCVYLWTKSYGIHINDDITQHEQRN